MSTQPDGSDITILDVNTIYDTNINYGNGHGIINTVNESSAVKKTLTFNNGDGVAKNVAMQEDVDEQIGDLAERLSGIEKQICVVRHDKILAEEFDELQEAYDQYQETLERIKTFQRLRNSK